MLVGLTSDSAMRNGMKWCKVSLEKIDVM